MTKEPLVDLSTYTNYNTTNREYDPPINILNTEPNFAAPNRVNPTRMKEPQGSNLPPYDKATQAKVDGIRNYSGSVQQHTHARGCPRGK